MSDIKARKKYIDAVKGFCIILVLFSHAGGIPFIGGILAACYMHVYFVIAGITYSDRQEETFRQFALKKAKRLLLPYAVYGAALWIIDCICEKLTIPEIMRGWAGVIYARHCLYLYQGHHDNLLLLDNLNGQLWFLPAIFISLFLYGIYLDGKWLCSSAAASPAFLAALSATICCSSRKNIIALLLPLSLMIPRKRKL